jgi:hypothetical protein
LVLRIRCAGDLLVVVLDGMPLLGREGGRIVRYGLRKPEMTVMEARTRMTLKMTPVRGSATCRLLEASMSETMLEGAMSRGLDVRWQKRQGRGPRRDSTDTGAGAGTYVVILGHDHLRGRGARRGDDR